MKNILGFLLLATTVQLNLASAKTEGLSLKKQTAILSKLVTQSIKDNIKNLREVETENEFDVARSYYLFKPEIDRGYDSLITILKYGLGDAIPPVGIDYDSIHMTYDSYNRTSEFINGVKCETANVDLAVNVPAKNTSAHGELKIVSFKVYFSAKLIFSSSKECQSPYADNIRNVSDLLIENFMVSKIEVLKVSGPPY